LISFQVIQKSLNLSRVRKHPLQFGSRLLENSGVLLA